MSSQPPAHAARSVLVVDDDAPLRAMIHSAFQTASIDVHEASDVASALALLSGPTRIDAVLTDIRMPGGTGLELAQRSREIRSDVPVVVMTGFGDLDTAIGAIRSGAFDFVPKPFDVRELLLRVRRAIEWRALHGEVQRLRDERAGGAVFESIIGRSPAMQRVFSMIDRVAVSDASVLVLGETGTGKELVARALHARSRRADGPFVAVNCAALPEALLEAELFGHAKGAFTDAQSARAGLFVTASRGTLFLDEIGEMPLALQAKILRALEQRVVRPVGSDKEVAFDARVVSATHRDLAARIADKTFREDLYYRLNVLEIRLPPLRSRGADVLLLANELLQRIAARTGRRIVGIDDACARCLVDYAWPGNVRELANVLERAVALAGGEKLGVADLPDKVARADRSHVLTASRDPDELVTLEEMEKRYILEVLAACGGHRARAAEVLGIDRKTLYARLKQYGEATPEP